MKPRSWKAISGLVVTVLIAACVGDDPNPDPGTSSGQPPGQGSCDATQKTCDARCVSKEDPGVGCGATACTPCTPAANADATCKAGACSTACAPGFLDCDSDPRTGCEAKGSSDVSNCGACGNTCGSANTDLPSKCDQGKCQLTCRKGFGHCGTAGAAGCETDLDTNALHCGACGHSCLGGLCTAGKCQPFRLASAPSPSGLAVDTKNVYFTSPSQNYIQRVQRDGKCSPAAPCPEQFVGSPDALALYRGPSAIISDNTTVWFTGQANGRIGRRTADPPGGTITNWGPAQSTDVGYLVLAGGKIWWTSGFGGGTNIHVRKSDLDGSNITTVASYQAPDTTFQGEGAIVADATHIYWASVNSGVSRMAFNDAPCIEDSTCTEIGPPGAVALAVDNTFVYWTDPASGSIGRALKTGGMSAQIASGQTGAKAIAVIGTNVYWGGPGYIRRAPQVAAPCVGNLCELVATVDQPDALIAANDGLYWTNRIVAGGVYRLAK